MWLRRRYSRIGSKWWVLCVPMWYVCVWFILFDEPLRACEVNSVTFWKCFDTVWYWWDFSCVLCVSTSNPFVNWKSVEIFKIGWKVYFLSLKNKANRNIRIYLFLSVLRCYFLLPQCPDDQRRCMVVRAERGGDTTNLKLDLGFCLC